MKLALNVPVVEEYLKKHNMTVKQLAERMDVSYVTLYRVMTGRRNPGNEFVAKLLKACDELQFSQLFIFTDVLPKGYDGGEKDENRETS